jgi:hypothetical protein
VKFSSFFSTSFFIVVALWGPSFDDLPYGIVLRIVSVTLIPFLFSIGLNFVWEEYLPSQKINDFLNRLLSLIWGVVLIYIAYKDYNMPFHYFNDQQILTRDGYEDVGNDVLANGPDRGQVLFEGILAMVFIWFGFIRNWRILQKKEGNH